MGLEHDISPEECFEIAASNNKNQLTEIINKNTLRTKILFNSALEYKNEFYPELNIESFYIKNMHGKTIIYNENKEDNLKEFTQYFTNNKTILQDHLEVIKRINNIHDRWYIEKQRKKFEEYEKSGEQF